MGIRLVEPYTDTEHPTMDFGRDGSGSPPRFSARHNFWFHPMLEHSFTATIEFVSGRGGVLSVPGRGRRMSFGIVLNIMREYIKVDYGDAGFFDTPAEFRRPILDAIGTNLPFVHDNTAQRVLMIHVDDLGLIHPIEYVKHINPSYNRILGPAGFGELTDNWSPDGYSPSYQQRLSFRFEDRPRLTVRRMVNGSRLERMEQLITFKFWVVARPGDTVLATSPEYTLGAWLETNSPGDLRATEPDPDYYAWGLPGRHRQQYRNDLESDRARQRVVGRGGQNPSVRPGLRGHRPVLTGETANERLRRWIDLEGIGPVIRRAQDSDVNAAVAPHR